jgi:hypothetical protein
MDRKWKDWLIFNLPDSRDEKSSAWTQQNDGPHEGQAVSSDCS